MRYEVKLVGAERDYHRLRAELGLLPAALRTLHPTRVVQSIYLDAHEAPALHDNLAGISERRKVRFRWYGDATERVRGSLEVKRRSSALGDKLVVAIDAEIRAAGARRDEFVRSLRDALPPAAREELHGLEPAQWIRYRRDYLTTVDRDIRVTIDRELCAYDQRYDLVLSCHRATPLPRLLVVEVKADAARRDVVEELLQHLDLRPSKCSKFVIASAPGEAPTPSRLS